MGSLFFCTISYQGPNILTVNRYGVRESFKCLKSIMFNQTPLYLTVSGLGAFVLKKLHALRNINSQEGCGITDDATDLIGKLYPKSFLYLNRLA